MRIVATSEFVRLEEVSKVTGSIGRSTRAAWTFQFDRDYDANYFKKILTPDRQNYTNFTMHYV